MRSLRVALVVLFRHRNDCETAPLVGSYYDFQSIRPDATSTLLSDIRGRDFRQGRCNGREDGNSKLVTSIAGSFKLASAGLLKITIRVERLLNGSYSLNSISELSSVTLCFIGYGFTEN